jgi:hypothetical protein
MGVEGVPAPGSVWRVPGMGWLLGSAMLWFAGFALLVPVAPLWVIRGGSNDLGAGLVFLLAVLPALAIPLASWLARPSGSAACSRSPGRRRSAAGEPAGSPTGSGRPRR